MERLLLPQSLGCGQSAQIRRVRGHACPQKPDNDLAFDDQEKLSISPTVSNSNVRSTPPPISNTYTASKQKSSVGPRYLPKTIYRRSRQTRSKLIRELKPRRHRAWMGYRPISLLSGLGKYSKVLKSRLSDHLLGKGLIINEQFGFRPNHSYPNKPSDLSNTSRRALNANENCVQLALFADDTALYLSGSNFRIITPRLQKAIDELTRWFPGESRLIPKNQPPYSSITAASKRKKLYHTTHQHSE
ncbi:hypothetical protein EVAR_44577_1 [Eumeta japonica]|uniref:RNA-directed DNA polymerase from transposon X-element n=1 Tax=Eumeta variegata TaxID=151549 RepID=A0A4C1X7Y5_EUMVA|nr:hypothetical protein EVAR_44577_1 [Eumeta japonica]